MKLYEKIQTIRVELQKMALKKSGFNNFAKYPYYKLDDFLPSLNELILKYKLMTAFKLSADKSYLYVYDIDDQEAGVYACYPFEIPTVSSESKGNPIQALAATSTYLRRYLYLIAFEISEDDEIEAMSGKDEEKKESKPITASSNSFDYAKDIIENCDTIERLEQVRLQLLSKKWSVADAASFKVIIEKTRGELNNGK